MALEGQHGVVAHHAAAVVSDLDELLAAGLTLILIRVAPASSEFSSSSLTTEAGRSTTSPAAILLATFSERTWMRPMDQCWSLVVSRKLLMACGWLLMAKHNQQHLVSVADVN